MPDSLHFFANFEFYDMQVQGLVYTFGDLRGAFAAVERINSILSGAEIDEALAYGLERQIHSKNVEDEKLKLFAVNGFDERQQSDHVRYMSAMGSPSNLFNIVRSGDINLEGNSNVEFCTCQLNYILDIYSCIPVYTR